MQMFKPNDAVYITDVKTKGYVKEVHTEENRFKVTYYEDGKRKLDYFKYEQLKPWRKKRTDNKYYYMVRAFHKAFGSPAPETPQRITEERKKARLEWMYEELREFDEAKTLKDEVDAMIDEIYFCIGTIVEMGVKPDRIFEAVNKANMAKLWPDGKPRFRNLDGKIVKPDGWQSPDKDIEAELERQMRGRK